MIGLDALVEMCALGAFARWQKRTEENKILLGKRNAAKSLPVIDKKLKAMAGSPTKLQRISADKMIKIARFVTNTVAFEYAVQGFMNPKSKMRLKKKRIMEVKTYL